MSIEDRLRRHNSNHNGYTGKANDWVVVHLEVFSTLQIARLKEKEIKKRGAKRYLLL